MAPITSSPLLVEWTALHIESSVKIATWEEDIKSLCVVVRPFWNKENINIQQLSCGTLHTVTMCRHNNDLDLEDAIIVKVTRERGSHDQSQELYAMQAACLADCGATVYASFNNGIIYGYTPGDVAVWSDLLDERKARQIMKAVASFNSGKNLRPLTPVASDLDLEIFKVIRKDIDSIPDEFVHFPERHIIFQRFFGSKEAVRAETDAIEKHLAEFNIPVVLSHNDLWVGNIIYNDKTDKAYLIDFEHADMNYEAWDIGHLFMATFSQRIELDQHNRPVMANEGTGPMRIEEHKQKLIRYYLEGRMEILGLDAEVSDRDFQRFCRQTKIMEIADSFWCGVYWMTLLDNPDVTVDAYDFCVRRFEKYFENRELLFSIQPLEEEDSVIA